MDLTKPFLLRESARDVVENGRHNKTDRETDEEGCVEPTLAKDLVGPESTPKYRGSEESVDTRAVEAVWCIGGTDILDMDLEVENTSADESGNKACGHLSPEGVARRNLGIVCKLEIVQELNSVSASDVAEGLEEVHGQGITTNPSTSDEFGQDVESDWNTSNGSNDTNRNDEDQTERETVKDNTNSGLTPRMLAMIVKIDCCNHLHKSARQQCQHNRKPPKPKGKSGTTIRGLRCISSASAEIENSTNLRDKQTSSGCGHRYIPLARHDGKYS